MLDDYCFYACSSLESLTIGENVETIGYGAFYSLSKLKSLVIPNSVKYIDQYCFSNCIELSTVEIGSGVEEIHDGAFQLCTGLSKVTSYSTVPPTCIEDEQEGIFLGINLATVSLYVPSESLNTYKNAPTWKDFGSFNTINSTAISKLEAENPTEDKPSYNIQGLSVNKYHKGLLIRDGKKFMNRF